VKRDPNKTARNRMLTSLKAQRRALQPAVFKELADIEGGKYCNELSLNAFIGGKTADYIALPDEVISTPMEYQSKWLSGLKESAAVSSSSGRNPRHVRMYELVTGDFPSFRRYLAVLLESSFLKHYEEHYKIKPKIDESEYWFGNNDDVFGLLVTPRFYAGQWENDKSEIRHFRHPYWTISHVMATGLCYMGESRMRTFSNIGDYLQFFRDMVRRARSPLQLAIADRYVELVNNHADPGSVPLLIPELRFDPHKNRHLHRLDYLLINPWSMEKFGFEFSPWSTHGKLKGAGRSMSEYDADAKANFEAEMRKHKNYWRRYGVSYVIYTDTDLASPDTIWADIVRHLEMGEAPQQLELALLHDLR